MKNFERPHEALGMRPPAELYRPSERTRPGRLPAHEIPEGALSRKVDASGKMSFRGVSYKPGDGLIGQWVQLQEEPGGYGLLFAGIRFAALERPEGGKYVLSETA